jgi:DNA polymerase-3 subunit epsilon
MNTFTAIDFETAHGKRWSICQVGLVRVENGLITNELSILVQPPNNFYWDWFIGIHHITPEMTWNAPTFASVWPLFESFIKNQTVVAHNGFSFDFNVLAKTLEYYGLEVPEYEKHCTYRLYKDNLSSLCQRFEIELNHHEALSDARACAELFLRHYKIENHD